MTKTTKRAFSIIVAGVCLLSLLLSIIPAFCSEEYAEGTDDAVLEEGRVDELFDPSLQEEADKTSELGSVCFILDAPETITENVNSVDIYCVSNDNNDDFIVSVLKEDGFKKTVDIPRGTYKTMYCDALGLPYEYSLKVEGTIMVGSGENNVNIYVFNGDSCVNETSYNVATPVDLVSVSDDYLSLIGKDSLYTEDEESSQNEPKEPQQKEKIKVNKHAIIIVLVCALTLLLFFFLLHLLHVKKPEQSNK